MMVSRQGTSEEPFLHWMRREWCLVLITTGVGLDWLPAVLASPESPKLDQLSGTKLLILPGLALAFVLRRTWVVKPHPLAVAYLGTLLIGGGMGWLAGNVEVWRLTAVAVNGFILLYFLKLRSLVSIKRILVITFVLSILIPVIQWLTKLGIVAKDNVEQGPGFERVFSIFDSTTVGFAPLMIAACLGGLIFVHGRRQRVMVNALLAVGIVTLGLTGALLAAQRSGVLAYAATVLIALVLYSISERKRLMWVMKLSVVLVVAVFVAIFCLQDVANSLQARVTDSYALEDAVKLRLGGITTFLSDLLNPLDLVPKGHQSLFDRTGIEPHLLLSEAYYEGGPLFLAAVVAILIRFGLACVALRRSSDATARTIGTCLCAFGCGAAIQLSLQTGLVLRLLPVVLGVGIAAHRIMGSEAGRKRSIAEFAHVRGRYPLKQGAR